MIFGIGTDILEISRIDKILKKHNQTFMDRVFGTNEIKIIENKSKNISLFLGKRFAAKEAVWKALSPKRGDGLVFKEIEILNNQNGKPYFFFSGQGGRGLGRARVGFQLGAVRDRARHGRLAGQLPYGVVRAE